MKIDLNTALAMFIKIVTKTTFLFRLKCKFAHLK